MGQIVPQLSFSKDGFGITKPTKRYIPLKNQTRCSLVSDPGTFFFFREGFTLLKSIFNYWIWLIYLCVRKNGVSVWIFLTEKIDLKFSNKDNKAILISNSNEF